MWGWSPGPRARDVLPHCAAPSPPCVQSLAVLEDGLAEPTANGRAPWCCRRMAFTRRSGCCRQPGTGLKSWPAPSAQGRVPVKSSPGVGPGHGPTAGIQMLTQEHTCVRRRTGRAGAGRCVDRPERVCGYVCACVSTRSHRPGLRPRSRVLQSAGLTLHWHWPLVLLQSGSKPWLTAQWQGPQTGFPHQPLGHGRSILSGKDDGRWKGYGAGRPGSTDIAVTLLHEAARPSHPSPGSAILQGSTVRFCARPIGQALSPCASASASQLRTAPTHWAPQAAASQSSRQPAVESPPPSASLAPTFPCAPGHLLRVLPDEVSWRPGCCGQLVFP